MKDAPTTRTRSEIQAARIPDERSRGDSLVAWKGRKGEITVDRVLRPRGKIMKHKANVPSDCMVTEMLRELPMESVYEITHWFEKRFRGKCRAPSGVETSTLRILKKPDAKLEKGLRGFRAIALISVLSKWYAAVLVGLLHDEKEPIELGGTSRGRREENQL